MVEGHVGHQPGRGSPRKDKRRNSSRLDAQGNAEVSAVEFENEGSFLAANGIDTTEGHSIRPNFCQKECPNGVISEIFRRFIGTCVRP